MASQYVPGEHRPRLWREIINVGDRFHTQLADVARPDAIIDGREDPWATGDRVAWGEASFPELDDVLSALEPVDAPSQLIHGNLTGNVLFQDELPPAIVDFAPYWRPTEFASAVVVADALSWEGVGSSIGGKDGGSVPNRVEMPNPHFAAQSRNERSASGTTGCGSTYGRYERPRIDMQVAMRFWMTAASWSCRLPVSGGSK
ncbi:MAG TPA: hypothetical protein VF253_01450 [Candidatus Limnocylindrales bacterium]